MEDLTKKIGDILAQDDKDIDLDYAATILLRVNRNRILHQNIVRRRNVGKLRYELQKIYSFRTREAAREETAVLERESKKILKETLPRMEKTAASETKGIRADHDLLPDEIKAKYIENQNIFPRMRKLHEQLKLMPNARPCDRYPFLQELVGLDKQLRANWDAYDAYVLPSGAPKKEQPAAVAKTDEGNADPTPAADAKKISAARKYLSDNRAKLTVLQAEEDPSKYEALLSKMQERLDLLIAAKAGVSEEYLKELTELGLKA